MKLFSSGLTLPTYLLADGVDSTVQSVRPLFPGLRCGKDSRPSFQEAPRRMKIEFTKQPSDCLAELGRHRMGEQVQGTHDAFRGDASAHIGFDNESRQAQRLLHGV